MVLRMRTFIFALLPVLCSASILAADQGRGKSQGSDKAEAVAEGRGRRQGDGDTYFHRRGHTRLNIPPGHYPPPGQCRIWHPGRPPGQQPPPGRCGELAARVPPGAWLIRHPERDREHVHVVVYDEQRPGSILITGQFKIADGVYVGVVVDR